VNRRHKIRYKASYLTRVKAWLVTNPEATRK